VECLSLAGLSSLVWCSWVSQGAYPKVEHQVLYMARLLPYFPTKLERFARYKHSSLLQKFINYGLKMFLT